MESESPQRPFVTKPNEMERRRRLPHIIRSGMPLIVTFCTDERWVLPSAVRGTVLRHCLHDNGVRLMAHAAVVMPDHVHFLFTPLDDANGYTNGLSEIMQGIKGASAHSVNKALRRTGRVWEPEYYDRLLRREESVLAAANYIVLNPVRKGLVREGEPYEWAWSAFDTFVP